MTKAGGLTLMARNVGLSVADYEAVMMTGQKYCMTCAMWHPRSAFNKDASRYDGLMPKCRKRRNAESRARYAHRRR